MTELGLGGLSDVSLVAARAEAAELREVLAKGGDSLLRGLRVDGKPVGDNVFPARNRRGHLDPAPCLICSNGLATERTNYAREVVEL
jgi:hypothetical protein